MRALFPVLSPGESAMLAQWLTPRQQQAFRELPIPDRAHLIETAEQVALNAPANRDLIIAALLHDIAKADGRYQVRLPDRVAKVILAAIAPGLLAKLAAPPPGRLRGGLVLAVHHPRIGAERARQLGCNERVCWLIANHERADCFNDPDLTLLARIDDGNLPEQTR